MSVKGTSSFTENIYHTVVLYINMSIIQCFADMATYEVGTICHRSWQGPPHLRPPYDKAGTGTKEKVCLDPRWYLVD